MDIKLMKNSEEGIFFPINDRLLMQITDDNYQYQGLHGKNILFLMQQLMRSMKWHHRLRSIISAR